MYDSDVNNLLFFSNQSFAYAEALPLIPTISADIASLKSIGFFIKNPERRAKLGQIFAQIEKIECVFDLLPPCEQQAVFDLWIACYEVNARLFSYVDDVSAIQADEYFNDLVRSKGESLLVRTTDLVTRNKFASIITDLFVDPDSGRGSSPESVGSAASI